MHLGADSIASGAMCVVALVAHECGHGGMALLLGDPSARERGRLTANPLPHLDPLGSVLLPLALIASASPILFAWARPVPIEHGRLRRPRRAALCVAMAGPAANILLALGFAARARATPEGPAGAAARSLAVAGVEWNCGLALFNLIPIPPLDGSWVLKHFLALRHILALHAFRFAALALTVAMALLPPTRGLFEASFHGAVSGCFGLFGLSVDGLLH